MKINNIQSLGSIYQPDKNQKAEQKSKLEEKLSKIEDKVFISKEAKTLRENESLSPKRKAEIEHRLKTGFYDKEEVIEKVADEILKSPEFKEMFRK